MTPESADITEGESFLVLDWLLRTYTPTWLELAGMTAEAQQLRDLPAVVDQKTAAVASALSDSLKELVYSIWDKARGAARPEETNDELVAAWESESQAGVSVPDSDTGETARAAAWYVAADAAWVAAALPCGSITRTTFREEGWSDLPEVVEAAARESVEAAAEVLQAAVEPLLEKLAAGVAEEALPTSVCCEPDLLAIPVEMQPGRLNEKVGEGK